MEKEKLYCATDLSKRYKLTRAQIIMDIRLGKLKGEKVGGTYIIRESDLKKYFREEIKNVAKVFNKTIIRNTK